MANQRRSDRRREALRERLCEQAAIAPPEPPETAEALLVREALGRIPPRDREILLLAEWEGLSPAQIATVMGCLAVTARGRLHRARQRFRAAFADLQGVDAEEPPHGAATASVLEGAS
jgi:RNA polymerase sigma factor (sigma-70 family)